MLVGANLILNDRTLPMREVAPLVEEYGLDALFIGEHTHLPVDTLHPVYRDRLPDFYRRFLDPFVQLSIAASVTSRVRLGTGILLVAERNPLELAKSVASLDLVSDGRVEVGIGYGWNPLEMVNNGVDPRMRRAVFREKLEAIHRLWTDDVASFEGEHVSFTPSWSLPKPVQRPHPPVLIGGSATGSTFDDIANFGTGWYPMSQPDAALEGQLLALAERCGGICPPVTVVEMAGQDERSPWYFSDARAGRELREQGRRLADLGVHRLSVGVPADTADHLRAALEHLAALSAAVA